MQIFVPTMSMYSFCLDCAVPFQRGRAGDAPGASLGRDAFACASQAAFLRLPVPGNGRAPGGAQAVYRLVRGLAKGLPRRGAFAGAPREEL